VELVQPVLVTDLDRVLALRPRQVDYELPAVDCFEAGADPLHAELGVRNVARKGEVRRTGRLVQNTALIRSPEAVSPVQAGGQRTAGHDPAIPRHGGVIKQVVADNIVELLRRMVRRDALEKSVAEVIRVLLRIECGVAGGY